MKRSFTSTTNGWLSNAVIPAQAGIQVSNRFQNRFKDWIPAFAGMTILLLIVPPIFGFQTEIPESQSIIEGLTPFERQEAGLAEADEVALKSPWFQNYLTELEPVFAPLEKHESEHFVLYAPAGQAFLADYALASLEKTAANIQKIWNHRPKGKVQVEIYPNKEHFSIASTLTLETLERSGAIGICKFHRLMIMSPKSLPMGYRWLDALSHEYLHMMINELSYSKAELWLHEGTARYFETAYRMDPPEFLTPDQKTKLLTALENKTLVSFERMSPSMVYLKDQEEVSLAFAEVSYAVSLLIQKYGAMPYARFLTSLRKKNFVKAFSDSFGMTPTAFEDHFRARLSTEKWEKSIGTMSDEVVFKAASEESSIGAAAQGQVRLGDRMRLQNLFEAALIQYKKALEQEPDNAIILLKAARTCLALNQTEEAVVHLRRAIAKNPNYQTPYIELARLVPPAEVVTLLLEANAINPFDPRIHSGLRDAYTALGRGEDAAREGRALEALTGK